MGRSVHEAHHPWVWGFISKPKHGRLACGIQGTSQWGGRVFLGEYTLPNVLKSPNLGLAYLATITEGGSRNLLLKLPS